MGFSFNGITSQSINIKARITNWQASPPLRNFYEIVPGKAGIADFGSDSMERKIAVSCNIFPQKNFADLVNVLDRVSSWLSPGNGLKQLLLDDVPDRYFLARISEAIDCDRILRTSGAFTLNFICPDPFAYALIDESFIISLAGTHSIERLKGNADSEPLYTLKGVITVGTEKYVSITTNGQELKIIGSLGVGESLIIDTGKVTAKVVDSLGNTLRNGLPHLQELNFPMLKAGINEVIISSQNATFTELKISSKSRWR
ncbi:phage tail family protein [Bacillaceae bacterium IKA-2]|nr:phage tail family protein [Bacillaceae bacterium IKA-2]